MNKEGRKYLFNDALNTFYLRLYGVRHMVKYHTDSERGNPLPPHGLLFPISSKGSFICTYHSLCYTSRGALAEPVRVNQRAVCGPGLLYIYASTFLHTSMLCHVTAIPNRCIVMFPLYDHVTYVQK